VENKGLEHPLENSLNNEGLFETWGEKGIVSGKWGRKHCRGKGGVKT